MEAIGQLTGGIAHDFNNLLGVIIGNVEFLIDTARDKDQAALAKEILNSALSGADLTRRLLAFARRQTLQPRRIDLNAYLPNHIAILRRLLGESTRSPRRWRPICGRPGRIRRRWATRCSIWRSMRATRCRMAAAISIETANAHLAARRAGQRGDARRLCRPLGDRHRHRHGARSAGARGGAVLHHQGAWRRQRPGPQHDLRLRQAVGRASADRQRARPRHDGAPLSAAGAGARSRRAGEATDAALPQGSESILLVDDNAEMRTVARRHLVSLGYQVSEAGSGPAALEILQAGDGFDLLFTDVVMPDGMTGYQLAAAARQLRPGAEGAVHHRLFPPGRRATSRRTSRPAP